MIVAEAPALLAGSLIFALIAIVLCSRDASRLRREVASMRSRCERCKVSEAIRREERRGEEDQKRETSAADTDRRRQADL